MKRPLAALVTIAASALALLATRPARRYVVEGRSMLRAYSPGDRLLVESLTYRFRQPRIGEVIVLRRPCSTDLKRIAAGPGATVMVGGEEHILDDAEWYVLGDNLSESQDSRELGPIRTQDILGRVWFRY